MLWNNENSEYKLLLGEKGKKVNSGVHKKNKSKKILQHVMRCEEKQLKNKVFHEEEEKQQEQTEKHLNKRWSNLTGIRKKKNKKKGQQTEWWERELMLLRTLKQRNDAELESDDGQWVFFNPYQLNISSEWKFS